MGYSGIAPFVRYLYFSTINTFLQVTQERGSHEDFKNAIKYFPGKFVTRRLFVQSSRKSLKSITDSEFLDACQDLCPQYGRVEQVLLGRNCREHLYVIFYKHDPESLSDQLSQEEYKKFKYFCDRKIKHSKTNLNACVFDYLKEKDFVNPSPSEETPKFRWKPSITSDVS